MLLTLNQFIAEELPTFKTVEELVARMAELDDAWHRLKEGTKAPKSISREWANHGNDFGWFHLHFRHPTPALSSTADAELKAKYRKILDRMLALGMPKVDYDRFLEAIA